ncbi:MAG: Hsp20 family protein [Oryzomonas sp.]|uniref:Hsp20/alpha crystallin family protein n=1 Tax=Oryzomonas sp. TaxID=2855186 RepID=UPI0028498E81|nr:Hsp20 family protein [Oryzomonas sp.]MDR3579639.1 Hsp20 family protein [Oryzomonas sp.]
MACALAGKIGAIAVECLKGIWTGAILQDIGKMYVPAEILTRPGHLSGIEFELANYYRQFSIPESLDHVKARAEYTNGILTLRVPKAEAAKPKRVAIQIS